MSSGNSTRSRANVGKKEIKVKQQDTCIEEAMNADPPSATPCSSSLQPHSLASIKKESNRKRQRIPSPDKETETFKLNRQAARRARNTSENSRKIYKEASLPTSSPDTFRETTSEESPEAGCKMKTSVTTSTRRTCSGFDDDLEDRKPDLIKIEVKKVKVESKDVPWFVPEHENKFIDFLLDYPKTGMFNRNGLIDEYNEKNNTKHPLNFFDHVVHDLEKKLIAKKRGIGDIVRVFFRAQVPLSAYLRDEITRIASEGTALFSADGRAVKIIYEDVYLNTSYDKDFIKFLIEIARGRSKPVAHEELAEEYRAELFESKREEVSDQFFVYHLEHLEEFINDDRSSSKIRTLFITQALISKIISLGRKGEVGFDKKGKIVRFVSKNGATRLKRDTGEPEVPMEELPDSDQHITISAINSIEDSKSSDDEMKFGAKIGEESKRRVRNKLSNEELKHLVHYFAECSRKQPDDMVFNEVYRNCVPYMEEKFGKELTRTDVAYQKILQKCFKTLEISLHGIEQEKIAAIMYATRWWVHKKLEIGLKKDFDIELDSKRLLSYYASKTDGSIQVGQRNSSRNSKVRCIDEPNINLINFVGERAKTSLKKWKLKEAVRNYLKSIDEHFDDKKLVLKVDKIKAMLVKNPERVADVDREKIAAILYAMNWPVCEKFENEFKKIAYFKLEKKTRTLLYYTSKNPNGWNTRSQSTDLMQCGSTSIPQNYKSKLRVKKNQCVQSYEEHSENEEEPDGSLRDDYDEACMSPHRSPIQRNMSTQERTPIPNQTEEFTNAYNLLRNIQQTVEDMGPDLLKESLTMLGDVIEFCPLEANVKIHSVAVVVGHAAVAMEEAITKDLNDTVALQKVHLLLGRIVHQVNSPKLDIIADHLRQLSIEKDHLGYRIPKKEFTEMIGKLIRYITKSEDDS
ncbi:hypothetical protein GCK72_020733 [Caenorhabditis remanei]|uniref:SPK domain-containing protein n=1 Tax=Caenorhabditis remanei TaxID=31234 RepID=A0A6A5GHL9_CAERE|nr:hypothetical protein GCK72_020733 [Caenorhabditis remanei]KAF1754173.1 hypothetical protein GCK72_020733 [Caenorhabditis remanei]